jgi:LuxR family maltose regulon positive regulatory protein
MLTTISTLSPAFAPERAAVPHQALYADVMDQISHTVHQLLLAALERAREKTGLPVPPAARAQVALSLRECEVLQRIAAGDSNKVIARALDLSPHTVKRHVANILHKLDLRSRGQAAAWWLTQHQRHPQQ